MEPRDARTVWASQGTLGLSLVVCPLALWLWSNWAWAYGGGRWVGAGGAAGPPFWYALAGMAPPLVVVALNGLVLRQALARRLPYAQGFTACGIALALTQVGWPWVALALGAVQ